MNKRYESLRKLAITHPNLLKGDPERANNTDFYHAGDTESLYKYNCRKKDTLDLLAQHQWINKKIFYRFNSQGFRSVHDYLDNTNHRIGFAFGCSNTLGEGVTEEQRWSNLLGKELNLRMFNFGVSGAGVGTNYRHAYYWLKKLQHRRPQAIFWLVPIASRFDFINDMNKKGLTMTAQHDAGQRTFRSTWFRDDFNMMMYSEIHIRAMQSLCDEYNVPLYMIHRDEFQPTDLARDLRHPGRESHKNISKLFYSLATIKP